MAKLAVIEKMEREVANLSEQLAESQLARISLSEEIEKLREIVDVVRSHFGDCMLMNENEFEKIVKGDMS